MPSYQVLAYVIDSAGRTWSSSFLPGEFNKACDDVTRQLETGWGVRGMVHGVAEFGKSGVPVTRCFWSYVDLESVVRVESGMEFPG